MRSQWESYYVAKEYPSARGWLRQIDVKFNPLFYDGNLTAERYRSGSVRTRCAGSPCPTRRSATAAMPRSS